MQPVESEELELYAEGPRFWSRETLRQVVERFLGKRHFIVVSNREPYIHRFRAEEIVCERPVSGLVTALEPVMRTCGGTWVAHGSGNADRDVVDEHDRVRVPPDHPEYVLRRVWLSKEDEDAYYYGFANEALWPLCHIAYQRPLFEARDWETYVRVNRQFADVVLDEARGEDAIVLIQDYHFAVLPLMLREERPDLLVAQFWHIPWPNREAFRVCPWARQVVEGLLGNDLLGFHIRYHCHNFLDTVASTTESLVNYETLRVTTERMQHLQHELGLKNQRVLLGIDRIDYTKGIPERLRAFDRLLVAHPELLGQVRFVQIGAPSRTRIPRYQELATEISSLVEDINWKHARDHWIPIAYRDESHRIDDLLAFYRLADVCVTSPLHDGMNLVAKEYVAARSDGDGVLVLSRFTGSARELEHALQVNPYAIDETATTLYQALCMDESERRARMTALRETVSRNNIYRWAGKMVTELGRIAARRSLEATA
jgi:trehalose-6-phosphate synthase